MSLESDVVHGAQARSTKSTWHTRSFLGDYTPPDGGCPCLVYLEHLHENDIIECQRQLPPRTRHHFVDLKVVHAWHVKTKRTWLGWLTNKPIREHVILEVRLPDDARFFLRVERVRENTIPIDSMPLASRNQLKRVLEQIGAEEAVGFIRSLPADVDPPRPWNEDDVWASVTATLIHNFPPDNEVTVVEEVSFNRESSPLRHAIGLAAILSAFAPLYSVFAEQGYFFTSTFMELLKAECDPLGVDVKEEGPKIIRLFTKAGKGFSVPVVEFTTSFRREFVCREWIKLQYNLDEKVALDLAQGRQYLQAAKKEEQRLYKIIEEKEKEKAERDADQKKQAEEQGQGKGSEVVPCQ